MSAKPKCENCGADDYEGELGVCPFCDRTKCSSCDPGNDVPCGLCEEDEAEEWPVRGGRGE